MKTDLDAPEVEQHWFVKWWKKKSPPKALGFSLRLNALV